MKYTVKRTIRFTSGTFRGLQAIERASYPTKEACEKFGRIGRRVKESRSGPGYVVIDSHVYRDNDI